MPQPTLIELVVRIKAPERASHSNEEMDAALDAVNNLLALDSVTLRLENLLREDPALAGFTVEVEPIG